MSDTQKESAFLVTNASGRHINLLNDNEQIQQPILFAVPSPPSSEISDENVNTADSCLSSDTHNIAQSVPTCSTKRKYHCTEPGCTKSFTTSGHLARHNRIHTGEKNFPCLFPGCQSRFSRQDNMMQHYRTHMSPKSRRTQKRVASEDLHPRPRLHAHQRIRSDPYRVERPLTIDQHLNNYHKSLLSHPPTNGQYLQSVKYNMPTPLSAVAASHMQKQLHQTPLTSIPLDIEPITSVHSYSYEDEPKIASALGFNQTTNKHTYLDLSVAEQQSDVIFYQHRSLMFHERAISNSNLPFTLLHPSSTPLKSTHSPPSLSSITEHDNSGIPQPLSPTSLSSSNNAMDSTSSPSSSQTGLLQLAHIVSTFG